MNASSRSLILGFSILLPAAGLSCGTAEAPSAEPSNGNTEVVVPKPAVNTNLGPVSNANSNVRLVPLSGTENLNADPTRDNSRVRVVNTAKIKPANMARPAPGNSLLETKMNPRGEVIQTRVFRDDPVLLKMVRRTIGPKNIKLTVFLRNGKKFEIPDEKIEHFTTAGVTTILKAVGQKPGRRPDGNTRRKSDDKLTKKPDPNKKSSGQ